MLLVLLELVKLQLDNGPLENQSVKSRRTYQVGIVLADKFGRQSPVILSSSGVDTVFVDPNTGNADSTTAFNALRLTFQIQQSNTIMGLFI